jgi:Zn-dependent protease with chaperone function
MHSAAAHHALVERLAGEAREHPLRYRIKLALWAFAGFGAILLALAVTLLLSVGVLALVVIAKAGLLLKLAIVPLAMAWSLLKSLWIRFDPPAGRRLGQDEAPALRALVERLQREAGAPALAGIVINEELNAAAATQPRLLGLLGHRHWLVLGLPTLQRLDERQFAAVLAHEFGHFGAGHGRFGGWIYRVRASWFRVHEELGRHAAWMSKPLVAFFQWYAPYFNAYSFVLARSNEYEADAMAARVTSPQDAASALVAMELASLRIERDFWPGLQRETARQPEPPGRVYALMGQTLASPSDDEADRLDKVLAQAPNLDDTHPVLAQRLAALGVAPALPAAPSRSAAQALLGPLEDELVEQFSQEWLRWSDRAWREAYAEAEAGRARLAHLLSEASQRALTSDEIGEQACLEAEMGPPEAGLARLEAALDAAPAHARLRFMLGCELLDRNDARGVEHLEEVLRLDADAEEPVLQRLHRHAREHGGQDAAQPYRERLEAHFQREAEVQRERGKLAPLDQFVPAGLDDAQIASVREAIAPHVAVARLWVVRAPTRLRPHIPHYVLRVAWRWWHRGTQAKLAAIAEAFPLHGTCIVVGDDALSGRKRAYKRAAGPPVFQR